MSRLAYYAYYVGWSIAAFASCFVVNYLLTIYVFRDEFDWRWATGGSLFGVGYFWLMDRTRRRRPPRKKTLAPTYKPMTPPMWVPGGIDVSEALTDLEAAYGVR